MPKVALCLILILLGSAPATALAQDLAASHPVAADTPVDLDAEPEEVWYGWQLLALDAATLTMTIVAGTGLDDHSGFVPLMGLAGYLLGGPIVHLVHQSAPRAGFSLLLRVGAPLALGIVGAFAFDPGRCEDECWGRLIGGVLGAGVGALTAIIVDATVLAREPAPRASRGTPRVRLAVGEDRALLLAEGTF